MRDLLLGLFCFFGQGSIWSNLALNAKIAEIVSTNEIKASIKEES